MSSTKESRTTRLQETRLPTSRSYQMTKTKIALAAVLFAATSSAAFAQGSYANRHPGYAPRAASQSAPVLQQRDVSLPGTREGNYDGVNQFNANRFDHASSPFAGGGG